MTHFVKIKQGTYRSKAIENVVFPIVKPLNIGKKGAFITVDGTEALGEQFAKIRVLVQNPADDLEYVTPSDYAEQPKVASATEAEQTVESEEDAIERIAERFDILDRMTHAVAEGTVRGMIVSGPPGVGKSFGVETVLEDYDMLTQVAGKPARTEIVKGSMTPIGLYQTLYMNSDKGNVLVFDDCDSILFDEVCLNMLKAVLDSGKKRTISWKSESSALRREGIPDRFDFEGGVIFITNVNFECAL
jgi:predicted PilT family ATPase